jgi:hypothetical protein
MNIEHWCNNTDREKLNYLERNVSQYHFAHHISYVDRPRNEMRTFQGKCQWVILNSCDDCSTPFH